MPKYLSSELIKQYTKDRAELEVELCTKLYDAYNGESIKGEIRETIAYALENVVALVILPGRSPLATAEAVKEGGKLQVFEKHHVGKPTEHDLGAKCRQIIDKWKEWDAADCSDLARFMGSVLEKAAVGPEWNEFTATHDQYKPDQYYKNDPKVAGRSRDKISNYQPQPWERNIHPEVGRSAGLAVRIKSYDKTGKELESGISPFRLMPWSTVRRIDIAFGLPEGADISGTTSDSIIVNRLVARFCAAVQTPSTATSKLLQLLPLVTMVSHGHHTFVESALTLSLFGVCTYRIGFYTTLLSKSGWDTKSFDVGGEILKILQWAEDDKRNHHILCWWDHNLKKYTGEEYVTPEEVRQYRSFGITGEAFLKYFRHNVHDMVYAADLAGLKSGAYLDLKRVM